MYIVYSLWTWWPAAVLDITGCGVLRASHCAILGSRLVYYAVKRTINQFFTLIIQNSYSSYQWAERLFIYEKDCTIISAFVAGLKIFIPVHSHLTFPGAGFSMAISYTTHELATYREPWPQHIQCLSSAVGNISQPLLFSWVPTHHVGLEKVWCIWIVGAVKCM